jgi:adenosylcobinamide-GDP ribazoletransferase
LATRFRGASPWPPLILGAVLSASAAVLAGWPALVAVGAAGIAAAAVVAFAVRRLGGFTGDVLGAAGMLAETVGLVVASARWPGW